MAKLSSNSLKRLLETEVAHEIYPDVFAIVKYIGDCICFSHLMAKDYALIDKTVALIAEEDVGNFAFRHITDPQVIKILAKHGYMPYTIKLDDDKKTSVVTYLKSDLVGDELYVLDGEIVDLPKNRTKNRDQNKKRNFTKPSL